MFGKIVPLDIDGKPFYFRVNNIRKYKAFEIFSSMFLHEKNSTIRKNSWWVRRVLVVENFETDWHALTYAIIRFVKLIQTELQRDIVVNLSPSGKIIPGTNDYIINQFETDLSKAFDTENIGCTKSYYPFSSSSSDSWIDYIDSMKQYEKSLGDFFAISQDIRCCVGGIIDYVNSSQIDLNIVYYNFVRKKWENKTLP